MMRSQSLWLFAVSMALAGCGGAKPASVLIEKRLTVRGSMEDVHRFARLQGSFRPSMTLSPVKPGGNGKAETTVTIRSNEDGKALLRLTREALAANLEYRYHERRITRTRQS